MPKLYLDMWHWHVRVIVAARIAIEESGDAIGSLAGWARVGECLRRRGDDIAALAINHNVGGTGEPLLQGNLTGPRLEIQISVEQCL